MKFKYILIFAGFLLSSIFSVAQDEITKNELNEHVSYLASDKLKGRKPGTKGGLASAKYIAKKLKKSGLKLKADKGLQYFNVITGIELSENNSANYNQKKLKIKSDYMPVNFTKNGQFSGKVVFAGYGISVDNDKISWNDYNKLDAKGKWVLVLKGFPKDTETQKKLADYSDIRGKTLTAKDMGALGIIFVNGKSHSTSDDLSVLKGARGISKANIPVIELKRAWIPKLFPENTIETLENYVNLKTLELESTHQLSAEINVNFVKTKTQNVVAFLPGNDPKYKHEVIVIGAHYDHLGMGGYGSGSRVPDTSAVHNGADDNASGVAGIMEIAEKVKANWGNTKRSLLVVAFGAEEMGLLGSKYYVDHPILELKHVKAMVNFDMIGRLKENKNVSIGGIGTAEESEQLVKKLAEGKDFKLSLSKEGFGPSDHASFYTNNIPVFFISTGAHGDYHTPKDDVEFLNFNGMKSVSDFGYELVFNLLTRKETLNFTQAGPKKRQSSRGGLKVTLGIMPAFGQSDVKGLGVDGVTPGRPAEGGGMKKGDIITAINGKAISNIYDYMNRLKTLTKGEQIKVDVLRKGEKKVLIIQL